MEHRIVWRLLIVLGLALTACSSGQTEIASSDTAAADVAPTGEVVDESEGDGSAPLDGTPSTSLPNESPATEPVEPEEEPPAVSTTAVEDSGSSDIGSTGVDEPGFVEMIGANESTAARGVVPTVDLLMNADGLVFVSGPVVSVDLGPAHAWETDYETGGATRIDVPIDSPKAMVQMIHVEIATRHLAASDISEFEDSVLVAIATAPGTSTSAVFEELSELGDIATFIFKSAVSNYRADLWTDVVDGQGIGFVQQDKSVQFPAEAMQAVQIENVDTFVGTVLRDAGFETRST